MRRALRVCMVALVTTSFALVQITEAARWIWLGPLLGLTLLAPWLLGLTRFMACRLLWNLSVLGAFAQLVQHVTYAGAAYLLEDGLLLAALCQVHLVNNLSDAQKPDLLFFNSFLIAVVTSFLSVDLGYSLVLLAYAILAHWVARMGVRSDELKLIQQLATAIAADINLERNFTTIQNLTRRLVPWDHMGFARYDEARHEMLVIADTSGERAVGVRYHADKGLTGEAVRRRSPVVTGQRGSSVAVHDTERQGSEILVPLFQGERLVGAWSIRQPRGSSTASPRSRVPKKSSCTSPATSTGLPSPTTASFPSTARP